jgi:2-oxoglutarate decarboxylase
LPNPAEYSSKVQRQLIEEFGANASYVETLLDRYLSSPSLVDESWRLYFGEILGNGNAPVVAPSAPTTNGVASANGSTQKLPVVAKLTGEPEVLRGAAKKLIENMEQSLAVPVATSIRQIPVKLLDENRRIINQFLERRKAGKASYTHIIAWAIVEAMRDFPQMNDGYFLTEEGPTRVHRTDVNIGIAIDIQKRDGSRTLLVPNIKKANDMTFSEFLAAYDDKIKRARAGKLEISDFEGTTVSLTNPGTIGTVGSVPRLMAGQSMIIATGAIEYPAEYQAMMPEALSMLGVSKVVQISNTYDHRVIQGAESGAMLARMHELLIGKAGFYERLFATLQIPIRPFHWAIDRNPALLGGQGERVQMRKQASVLELINAYRVRGHLLADIDPLHATTIYNPELDIETYGLTIWDLDREFSTGGLAGIETATLRKILDVLHKSYCGTVGIEYRHIQSREEKLWLRERIEVEKPAGVPVEVKKRMLWKLISAEQFEQFLHKNFLGQKRFSVEGTETVIALLDQLIDRVAERGVTDLYLGMAHRGRLNVVANVLGHYCERIFTAFEGSVHPNFPADEGDVKYHQGGTGTRDGNGHSINLTLSPNPSHLEAVDAVVEGMTRGKQELLGGTEEERWARVMPVLMHGDAAFAGQGIVMETLNLGNLRGYRVGGTIHIVVNNQIGFTTSPEASRSTIYSTDVARMVGAPIFHINADDPDAAYRILMIALEYREKFHKDVVMDIVGFRRLGHNEADEPTYTQPLMYARVKAHPGIREIYAQRLIANAIYTEQEIKELIAERNKRYSEALARAKDVVAKQKKIAELAAATNELDGSEVIETAVPIETLRSITEQISIVPQSFHLNPKMVGQLARRAKMGSGEIPADWAFGEALAFGSLVIEGTRVRLSGQDSGRGTFSQRHAAMYDIQNGEQWVPLSHLENASGIFEVFDSSLSEEAVMGYEYGYSTVIKDGLTLWEAQFGDFANGAQTIIDQFITSAEDKWQQTSRLVLLLPHGFEGQGPEHSSARLERYLELCAENNIQVAYPTTPAQYFHLLRRQVISRHVCPLIIMTPKSLLRLPAAGSTISEFSQGGFQPILVDDSVDASAVTRVAFCSGKVYYDLVAARESHPGSAGVAVIRVEQLYPFPTAAIERVVSSYPNAQQIAWVQEEPQNMGAWRFVRPLLEDIANHLPLLYVGRAASASPATGSYTIHNLEQKAIVEGTFAE